MPYMTACSAFDPSTHYSIYIYICRTSFCKCKLTRNIAHADPCRRNLEKNTWMANRKSHAVSLLQPSLRSLPGSPVRILTRSCSQNNASVAPPTKVEPLPTSSLSTAAQPRPTPPAPLQATAPSVANNVLEEQPATANSELAKPSQDEVCPPGSYSCNNSNVNCKCGTTIDDGSQMVQCEICGSWSHLHCAGLTARSAKKATFKCHTCNPSVQKKSTQRAASTKTSKSTKKSNSSRTQWRCTPEVLLKAISPMLPKEDFKSVVVKKSYRRLNGKSKWWFTIIAPPNTLSIIKAAWPTLQAESCWVLQSFLRKHHPSPPTCPLLPTPPPQISHHFP